MTLASQQALEGMRDLTTLKWYVIPLLAIVFYIYTSEIKKARQTGDWDAIFAGLTLFGMDFINETWNGWVLYLTERSACWTAPGDTALRTLVGWNIEIMFMFSIAGIIFYNTLPDDRRKPVLGIPVQWFWAVGYSAFCVFVECLLNKGGLLVWEYPWWNLSPLGLWPIFFLGYFIFYAAVILVINLKETRSKIIAVAGIYAVAIVANLVCKGFLGWVY